MDKSSKSQKLIYFKFYVISLKKNKPISIFLFAANVWISCVFSQNTSFMIVTRNKTSLKKQTHIMSDTTMQFLPTSPAGHSRAEQCLGKHSTDTPAVKPVGGY